MFYQILGWVFMFETTPFLGFKLSFWEGFRIHFLYFEFGIINSKINVRDYLREDLPEFGITFGIDKAFPNVPDVYFSFWDLTFNFRLFPKFRIKTEKELPINNMTVWIHHKVPDLSTAVESVVSVVFIDYSFLGVKIPRKHFVFRFESHIDMVNKFTNNKISLIGLRIPNKKQVDDAIEEGELHLTMAQSIDPTDNQYITSLDV